MSLDPGELAVLGALAPERAGLDRRELEARLVAAGVGGEGLVGRLASLAARGLVAESRGALGLTPAGARHLQELTASLRAALDPSPDRRALEACPSIPLLTTVQTTWIDAISLNYAVDPAALAPLLPAPLAPELHRGSAWVQVLVSSLRDMRPQGLMALFGVNFYQISYRAAVTYRSVDGSTRRGGYFVRSDTNHEVMRAVGLSLKEFKFHEFGEAKMTMVRHGSRLSIGVDPDARAPGGKLVGVFDTRPLAGPPPGSVWSSVDDLSYALVECYDALGVDHKNGYLYVLTIDRDPWHPSFVEPVDFYCEYVADGPLRGHARLDSVLHVRECAYRWRPLRRERLAAR
jgi:uncharacterized protein YqjF (DUF2071 family)